MLAFCPDFLQFLRRLHSQRRLLGSRPLFFRRGARFSYACFGRLGTLLALYLDPGHYSFTVELGFPTLALAGFGFSFQCGLGAGIWNQAIVLSSWSSRTLALTGFSFQCGLEATVLSRCSLFRAFCGRLQLSMWAWSRYLEPGHCSFLVELGFRTLALAGFSFQCGLGAGFGTRPLFFIVLSPCSLFRAFCGRLQLSMCSFMLKFVSCIGIFRSGSFWRLAGACARQRPKPFIDSMGLGLTRIFSCVCLGKSATVAVRLRALLAIFCCLEP